MSPCAAETSVLAASPSVRSEGGALVVTTVFTVTEFYENLYWFSVSLLMHEYTSGIILKYFMLLRFTGT